MGSEEYNYTKKISTTIELTVYIPNRHNKKDVIILIVISGGTSDPLRPINGRNKSVTLMANIIVNGRGHNAII